MKRVTDIDDFEAAWSARDAKALAALGARIGCKLDVKKLAKLDGLRGVVAMQAIAGTIAQALADDAGLALREEPALDGPNKMVVLAVRDPKRTKLTVGIARMRTRTKLGTVWPELTPWFKELARNRDAATTWAATRASDRVVFALDRGVTHAVSGNAPDLLRQVIAAPTDTELRGVLADTLLEAGDPRGELIRLGLELDALAWNDHKRRPLVARITTLEKQHGPNLARDVTDHTATYELRGGFVDAVTLTTKKYAKHGEALFATQPIRQLSVDDCGPATMTELAKAPHLPKLRALEMAYYFWTDRAIDLAPLKGLTLAALEELKLRGGAFTTATAFAPIDAPRLRRLTVEFNVLTAAALGGLVAKLGSTLAHLELGHVRCDVAGRTKGTMPKLAPMPVVESLDIMGAWFEGDARCVPWIATMRSLRVFDGNYCTSALLAALGKLPALEEVTISEELPTPAALAGLLRSSTLRTLLLFADDAKPAAFNAIADQLLALPKSHPLTCVALDGAAGERLKDRFT